MASESPAISLRNVTKQYRVRHEKGRTLKELFLRQRIYTETINAMDQVSFDVRRGTTLGIIGSNGSGKSTTLKLIAGTSRPTSGTVEVNGRVSALLELGAGFHPDFTGRENVYLDGAIMGLSKQVIDERFDEIVAFSEIGNFIDAPAKTYSSGMYMRLAFAVAVNVDPDIVLIDEVFAVGDVSFQRKCLERIDKFKSEGKTILFVSHSTDAVRNLCDEAIWIEKGKLQVHGSTDKVIDHYLWAVNEREEQRLSDDGDEVDMNRWGTRRGEIVQVGIFGPDRQKKYTYKTGEPMWVKLSYKIKEKVERPVFGIGIHRGDGILCFATNTSDKGEPPRYLSGEGELWFEIDALNLLPGDYQLSASFHNLKKTETYDYHDRKYRFKVLSGPDVEIGMFHFDHRWPDWKVAPGGADESGGFGKTGELAVSKVLEDVVEPGPSGLEEGAPPNPKEK